MKIKKLERYLLSLGMIGALLYISHTMIGNILWEEYNPVTTDISSLTADGAPHAEFLRIIGILYGICMILFVTTLLLKSFRQYRSLLKIGFIILLLMQLTSMIGYSLFPLSGDKTVMNFQNTMHMIVTVIVVFTTITSSFLISFGYLKQENMRLLGNISLIMSVLITLFGAFNPISMGLEFNILGLTERLVIYSIQLFMFILSYYYVFVEKSLVNMRKESLEKLV